MEGVSYESASLAGHLKLDNLIYLYDDNKITIDGSTDLAFTEDVTKRFESAGWHVSEVADGNDMKAIEKAIKEAQKIKNKPKLIRVKTIIGFGMPKQGTSKAHSDAPGEDAVKETKRNLGWHENKHFYIPKEVFAQFRESVKRGAKAERDWTSMVKRYEKKHAELGRDFHDIRLGNCPTAGKNHCRNSTASRQKRRVRIPAKSSTRSPKPFRSMIGGSGDLTPSNNTYIKSSADFQAGKFENRNIHFGIREHAMGSTMNGMALYGSVIPFGGTFQTFSDYMRPAIRLAALSQIQVVYVFTHDSIGLGEDGPTHQSVEHLAALRAIPNLAVIRPCDAHETREAWRAALKRTDAPTAFALSRQKVALIDRKKFAAAKACTKAHTFWPKPKQRPAKPQHPN